MFGYCRRLGPGRYYGIGRSHTYAIMREGRTWLVRICKLTTIAGVPVAGDEVATERTDTQRLAQAVATAFEALGDDYQQHEHGYRSRATEAVLRAYDAEAAR